MHSGRTWRLGHRPGLDGLRAVAILLVVLTHTHVNARSGSVGVTMFFALSGFLIATLLMEEGDRVGRVSIRGFYRRRAQRLLPALVVMVAFASVVNVALPGFTTGGMQLGSLLYVGNWVRVFDHSQADALAHTWSLSIEEQFYLVAPLVVIALRRRPRLLAVVCLVVAAASLCERLALVHAGSSVRAHLGADSQLDKLLIGVVLAALMRAGVPALTSATRRALVVFSVVALLAVAQQAVFPTVFRSLGPTLVGLSTVALIVAVLDRPGWLGNVVLVWVGRRSYGIYLWHYPLLMLAARSGVPWGIAAPVTVVVALLVAAASYRWVEVPLRRFGLSDSADAVAGAGVVSGGADAESVRARVAT